MLTFCGSQASQDSKQYTNGTDSAASENKLSYDWFTIAMPLYLSSFEVHIMPLALVIHY